jgi:hypothetical protein
MHSRFKPGQSGNPKGRPGGKRLANYRKSLDSPMWKILREKLTLREGERTITMTKLEAALHNYVAEALKGETRAIVALMELAHHFREFAPEPQKPSSLRVQENREAITQNREVIPLKWPLPRANHKSKRESRSQGRGRAYAELGAATYCGSDAS